MPLIRSLTHLFRFVFAGVLVGVSVLSAQSVRWDPEGGSLARNQATQLSLVFEDCKPTQTPKIPVQPGLDVSEPSTRTESSFSLINGTPSHTSKVIMSYSVFVTAPMGATLTIPAFAVETNKGRLTTAAISFTVGQASVGGGNTPLSDIVSSRFSLPPDPVWAGQVFSLNYVLQAQQDRLQQVSNQFDWDSAPLIIQDWPQKPEQTAVLQNGERTVRFIYRTNAMAPSAGDVTLSPARQAVALITGSSRSFGFFSQPDVAQFTVSSDPAKLVVKALPSPAPADFSGAVGNFTLESKVVPAEAKVGEPVTWTLTLAGSGNWPLIKSLPPRAVSKDFQVVQPQAKQTPAHAGALFDASLSEDAVLIPTKAGDYTLAPVRLSVFDPQKGEYRTLTTKAFTVHIRPAPAAPPSAAPTPAASEPPPGTGGSESAPSASSVPPAPTAVPPSLPSAIPLDPLPDAPLAGSPWETRSLALVCLLPFCLPPLLWIVLALCRSRKTDPNRPLREARKRLRVTLDRIAVEPTPRALQLWCDDAARLWQIHAAAPTHHDFDDPVWGALWAESERVRYRAGTTLSPEWLAQARQSLERHKVASWSPWQLFARRNLLPWLGVIGLCLLIAPQLPAHEIDGAAAYRSGEFEKAEQAWRERVQAQPTDWTARYNLSLALAQRGQWDEAAAQAAVAWLQHPSSKETRWQLLLAAGHSPNAASAFLPFVARAPLSPSFLAGFLSVRQWQWLLLSGALLCMFALGAFVAAGYRGKRARFALPVLIVGLALALVSIFALRVYGPLAKRQTLLVWQKTALRSIPTDAVESQQSSTLEPGTLALPARDKDFLGWRQLRLANGQTGWVREETLIPLWTDGHAAP